MSHFAYNIKTDEDGIPKIKTWNNLQRLNQFRKDIFDPYSLDKKADTVLKSIGDPRDPRTFGERMADNILSDLQSNTLKHNRQNYEVNFGGEWAKRLDKYSKRGRNMICWLDKEPEDLKREMELFEKMDTTVGLSKEQKEYVKNIQKVIDTKEDIFVHRGVNNIMFMSSPSLTSISFWDENVDGGRITEMDIEKIDPDIREFFYSEMENVEISARRRMVEEICQKTQLPKELFLEGVYESPFDGVEKPRYNNHLIEKFIDKRDYLETPYELSRMMTASGKVYGNPETEEERKELVERSNALEAYQSAPDAVENLEKIPVLSREDISKEIEPIINEEKRIADVPVVYHEIETNGIGYVDVLFDMSGLEEADLPYVGILQGVLGVIDTENYKYGELFNEINVHTGGIGTSLELYTDISKVPEKEFKATFEIKGKALYQKLPVVFRMMEEILTRSKLGDTKRIREILAMQKSRLLMKFQSSGHTTAVLRAMSYASPSSKLKDMTSGIEFYDKIAYIEEHFEEEKDVLVQKLQMLAHKLFRADNMMISYTAAKEGLNGMEELVEGLKEAMFEDPVEDTRCVLHCEMKNEGFKTASKVQYVARVGNFIDNGADYTGALQILKVILSYDYLWQNIRVKGGAYGCMSGFSRTGEGYFVSYRDPNLERTMEVYEGIADYLRNFTVSDRDMNKYIIGTMSNIDQPMTPSAKGDRSFNLYMNKVSAETIKKERLQILEAGQEDIRKLADVVEAVMKAEQVCVIGSEEKIEEAKDMFKNVTTF